MLSDSRAYWSDVNARIIPVKSGQNNSLQQLFSQKKDQNNNTFSYKYNAIHNEGSEMLI